MADEAMLKATKAIQAQRVEIAKRVANTQSKIVEAVFSSMLKESKLTIDQTDHDQLVVVNADARKELEALRSGGSGRAFFDANVALRSLVEDKKPSSSLGDVLKGLAQVGQDMQAQLERTLTQAATESATLAELSHPSNSYFVSMRPDAVTAIRTAHERLNTELAIVGGTGTRHIHLWEVIEGGCSTLVLRFAEVVGFLLVQTRSSTGVAAMYVGHNAMAANAVKARVALARLVAAAQAYARAVPSPWSAPQPTNLMAHRAMVLAGGERVGPHQIAHTGPCGRAVQPVAPMWAPIPSVGAGYGNSHGTGWYVH